MGSALNIAGFGGVTENYCVGVVCLSFWILKGHAAHITIPSETSRVLQEKQERVLMSYHQ